MSRRGNYYGNAVAESFFQLLRRERIQRKIYPSRGDSRQAIFNYIEMFYNPVRRHCYNDNLSPVGFEHQHINNAGSFRKHWGDSVVSYGKRHHYINMAAKVNHLE